MTPYTVENLNKIACFDVSSSELVIVSEIKLDVFGGKILELYDHFCTFHDRYDQTVWYR